MLLHEFNCVVVSINIDGLFTSKKSIINPNSNANNNLEILLHLKTKNNDSKILSDGAPDTIITFIITFFYFASHSKIPAVCQDGSSFQVDF